MSEEIKREIQLHVQQGHNNWYTKGNKLGNGCFGVVYLCSLKSNEKQFATKILKNAENVESWQREVSKMQRLNHENIIMFYYAEQVDSDCLIYMEYAENGSLKSIYEKDHLGFTDQRAGKYTRDVLYGLQYLHGQKILHRDIKCANILVVQSGKAKLSDFGIACGLEYYKNYDPAAYRPFAPPEVMKGEEFSYESDIWLLGVTLLEMKIAQTPSVQHHDDPLKDYRRNNFSDSLMEFLVSCMKTRPRDRKSISNLLSSAFITAI